MTKPPLKVLVLGVNGFIGTSLAAAVLKSRDWDLYGMDVSSHKLGDLVDHPLRPPPLMIVAVTTAAYWDELAAPESFGLLHPPSPTSSAGLAAGRQDGAAAGISAWPRCSMDLVRTLSTPRGSG